jgi:hypothetical protein
VGMLAGFNNWVATQEARARRRFPWATLGTVITIVALLGGGAALLDSFKANTTTREWVLSVTLASITVISLIVLATR